MANVGYVGSPNIQVSTANMEIVETPAGWSNPYSFIKFSFLNYSDCHVKINGDTRQIFLAANQGFEIDNSLHPIFSFIIVEAGVSFQFIGAY